MIPTLRILALRKLGRGDDFHKCVTPEVMEHLSEKDDFVEMLRKAVHTRLGIIWKQQHEKLLHRAAKSEARNIWRRNGYDWYDTDVIEDLYERFKENEYVVEEIKERVRDNHNYLIDTFVEQIPEHVWPYYFSDFGPLIKIDRDGQWLDTDLGRAIQERIPDPSDAKKYAREYERRRKINMERILNFFRVPDKRRKKFMEQPLDYFSS